MDVNFPRSCISPIITLKQPASARGLEKGEQSFSRPLLGAAAYLIFLSCAKSTSALFCCPAPSFFRQAAASFLVRNPQSGGVFSFAPRNLASGLPVLHLLEGGIGASRTICGLGARPICRAGAVVFGRFGTADLIIPVFVPCRCVVLVLLARLYLIQFQTVVARWY